VKAILIVCSKDKDKKNKIIYLCLPFNNMQLMQKFNSESEKMGITMAALFNQSNNIILSSLLDNASNSKK
jgi:hypothetical protein